MAQCRLLHCSAARRAMVMSVQAALFVEAITNDSILPAVTP